jgi:2-dehydro-3-deoxy-L-fuconate 4-dehydrogenase
MSNRLYGKVALVSAAAQGIGRATALAFAEAGAEVWATDINMGALESLGTAHSKLRIRSLDVTDESTIVQLVREIGRINVLFNCAGYVHHGTILETTDRDWDFSFDINVKSM